MDEELIEIWKGVIGYEGEYQVSNIGRVRSIGKRIEVTDCIGRMYSKNIKGKILSPNDNGRGYLSVQLGRKGGRRYIHRLVAEIFIDNHKDLSEVNHLNNNRGDNHYSNLEWCTRAYNTKYKETMGTQLKGEEIYKSILKESDVTKIKMMLSQGIAQRIIAEQFNVNQVTISNVNTKKTWKHVV